MPQSATTSARAQEQEFKRARGAISCAECRRLKLKCDKTVPCSSCKRRGCSSICPNGSLTTGQGTRFILADTDRLHRKIAEMSDRIRQLEDALAILQSSATREPHPLLNGDLLKIKSGLELHSAISSPPQPDSEGTNQADEEAQYIDAFGTLAVRDDGAATFYGRSAGSESLLLEENPKPALQRKKSNFALRDDIHRLTKSFPASPSDAQDLDTEEVIMGYLPPWPRAAQLCDLYLEQAPWFFGAVTRRQLLEEVLPLFYSEARSTPASSSSLASALSTSTSAFDLPAGAQAQRSAHDLALLFVIFCFGALTDEALSPAPKNPEADLYFQLARAAMNFEPVLERPPSVVTVQTLSLMGIYQGLVADENSIEGTWALMGLSSKLAQSIGLHRDCARWKLSPAEVQKRRALFWELFITDCWQSLATGRLPTFSLPFVDTELPGDPDQSIADDGTVVPSFPAWKARFGKECVSEVVQGTLTSRAPKYTVILELDRKIRDLQMPRYALGPAPAGGGLRETMLHFMPINYRDLTLLYVHRCFFAQALTDHPTDPLRSQYAPSFLAGYRSACSLLSSLRDGFALFPVQIARFWVLWTHAFSAAVMLASVVTHGGTTKTAHAALGELRLAHDLFQHATQHGGRSVQFLPIITRLHDKAMATYTQRMHPVRKDIFTPSSTKQEQQDELSIFSGRTPRTVATKAHKKPSHARSVSRRRPAPNASNSPQAPSESSSSSLSPAMTMSTSGSGSGSASGSNRDSASPQSAMVDSFPALDSYGASVHPSLADQMRSFSGELDSQISSANAYYAAHGHGQEYVQEHEQPFLYHASEEWYAAPEHEAMAPPVPLPPSSAHAQYQHAMRPSPQQQPPQTQDQMPTNAQQYQGSMPSHPQQHSASMPVYAQGHSADAQYQAYGEPTVSGPVDHQGYAYPQGHAEVWGPPEGELMYPEEYQQLAYAELEHHPQRYYVADSDSSGQGYAQAYAQQQQQQHGDQGHLIHGHDGHASAQQHYQMMPPLPPPRAQAAPAAPVPMVPMEAGYSLNETWASWVQQEMQPPAAPTAALYARR